MAFTDRERTILGPLTTVFTPPAPCTIAVGWCKTCDVAWWGQTCGGGGEEDNTSCWPTTTEGVPEPTKLPLYGWGFYSPGLECPAGYTSACSAVEGVTSQWKHQFRMEAEETFVGCCPEGFKCDNLRGQTCLMRAKSTELPTVSCENGASNNFGFTTLPNAAVTTMNLYAPMIQLAWKASDRPETSTLSSSATTSAPTTTTLNPTSAADPNAPTISEPALSTGAIVGIAIGAAALFLLTLAAAIFIWRRRRRHSHPGGVGPGNPLGNGSYAPSYSALRAGSPGMEDTKHYYTGGVMEMAPGHGRVEAPTEGHMRVEMGADRLVSPASPLVEAPGQDHGGGGPYAAHPRQVVIRGEGDMSPPPGYFQPPLGAVEMPVGRYQ
ncbi:hypothetical protein CHGG_04079 [Chaetomium globosum CBS 148.51]|uniref:Uncharacterized protein n=1 Tax=Chaetomium globosum (strain ATCC 6205 / CBS 148.51 / DSM 1962 / NBRC 6347 / NRRL 1970) TaxID=306901 RepID=Q2H2B7_CHAGB|nr:uncharacterized protein CHGG_04079 [Chaetomium globosum CBS 148.51]EAQ87460.1 hypothetical protein CHGG_04079 [Chaetomium globosum CBS 148.51]